MLKQLPGGIFSDLNVQEDNSIAIGGFKASDKDGKIIADDTLDIRLGVPARLVCGKFRA